MDQVFVLDSTSDHASLAAAGRPTLRNHAAEHAVRYDVVVVGGGAAGSLVAGRLAAETEASVLLLEAGGRDWNPLIHMPAGFSKLLHHEMFLYPYATIPQAQLDDRPRNLEQGKGLGGGTSVNSMCYVRGQRADYDGWDKVLGGVGGWSYADLLPHFCAMEGNDIFAGPYHGETGPLKVIQPPGINALNQAVIRAFQNVGLPYNADYNGAEQRGVSPCQMMIGDARRCSTATAFLDPAKRRKNLTVVTGAPATMLILEGDRVTGVSYLHHGRTVLAQAGEVVVCAGALNTPRLLMLSGIGPEDELARHGIQLRVPSPQVGRNLQDHPQVPLSARALIDIGYARDTHGLRQLAVGLEYYLMKTGPCATNGIESLSHFNPDDQDADPTIQCFHSPVIVDAGLGQADSHPGLTLQTVVLQPSSRGTLTLRDADPLSQPVIDPNYLADPEDMRRMIGGLRYVREVLKAPALADILCSKLESNPDFSTDKGIADHARRTLATMWHPAGTCRMGLDDGAVVDPSLNVRGVRGLSVMDASIMPSIVSGNTAAPTMAIASKGVELVKRRLMVYFEKIAADH